MICWCSDFPATLAGNEDDAAAASDTTRFLLPRLASTSSPSKKRRPSDAGWLGTRAQFCAREIWSLAFLPTDRSGFLVLLWEISMVNYCSH